MKPAEDATVKVRLRISGRVQGVWFRGWSASTARRLGLDGWVRNLRDGSVEMVLAGPGPLVEQMIALCRQGPSAAVVEAIERFPEAGPVEQGFEQRPSE